MSLFPKKNQKKQSCKERIFECIRNMHIKSPSSYRFSKEDAISSLNACINRIRTNCDDIVYMMNSELSVHIHGLSDWRKSFDELVSLKQREISLIKERSMYEGYMLNDDSIDIVNHVINDLNSSVNGFCEICSVALNKSKYRPEDGTVFIVHGHNIGLKNALKKQLRKNGYNPIILFDMSDSGITLFEKFEKYANKSVKAIILMTNDDLIKKENESYYQARPNVLIELGYFLSILERKNIVVVCEEGCKFPSDVNGVAYLDYVSDNDLMVEKIITSLEHN